MKWISSSKVIGTFAVLATILTVAGASVRYSQKAKAQTETQSQEESTLNRNAGCEGTALPYPEEFFEETENGCTTLWAFSGIELTPEQKEVWREAEEQRSKRSNLMEDQIEMVVIPDGGIDVAVRSTNGSIDEAAGEAATAASIDDIPDAEQIDELNARFPEAEFFLSQGIRLTPEQVLEVIRIDREFEDTMLSVLTPEQQRLYLRNIAVMYWVKASDPDLTD